MAKMRILDREELERDPFASQEDDANEFEQLLNAETSYVSARRFKVGEQVSGTVISVGKDSIFVDLGGKSTGSLPIEDIHADLSLGMPKSGDSITAFVKQDNGSEIILARSFKRNENDVSALREAYEQGMPVEAKVEKTIKGGFEVSIGGKRGFVPLSGMDSRYVEDTEQYIGNVYKFEITQFSQGGRNIVLSRRALLKEEQENKVKEVLASIEPGQTYRGKVSRIGPHGVWVDLGSVEGFVHVSDLSWSKLKRPEDAVSLHEELQVKVLKVEASPRMRISLSVKDAGEDPWISHATRLTPGTRLQAQVKALSGTYAILELMDGITGRLSAKELSWDESVEDVSSKLSVGQSVNVFVLQNRFEKRELSLSLRGFMSEDMLKKLEARKRSGNALSEIEERNLEDARWMARQSQNNVSTGVMASAFANAKPRK